MNVAILDFSALPEHLSDLIEVPANDCYIAWELNVTDLRTITTWYGDDMRFNGIPIYFSEWIKDTDYALDCWILTHYAEEIKHAELILWEINW